MMMVTGVLKTTNGVVVVVLLLDQFVQKLLPTKVTNAVQPVVPFTTLMLMVIGVLKTTTGVVCQPTVKKFIFRKTDE
jgi:hypothetical protein